MYVSSVTVVHSAKAVEQNDMPFGRDTCVATSNTIRQGPGHPREAEI